MHRAIVYHTISAPEQPLAANIDVSPERFEAHLRWLVRRRERVVPLGEFLSEPESKSLLAITFDDGFRDNLTVALPLLEKYSLPMTLFVTSGFIGRENYLSREEVRTLAAHRLVTVASHGVNHLHLTRLAPDEARFELRESKRALEEITGKTIDLLAYPYGDCDGRIELLSRECGYAAAWSVWNGRNTPFSRWRVPLGRPDNLPRFAAKISPFYFPVKRFLKPPVTDAGSREKTIDYLQENEAFNFGKSSG